MAYSDVVALLDAGERVILDGGTGTELEQRGVGMSPGAWCGPASLDSYSTLVEIHKDYLIAGAQVITANTYASSRVMLKEAGYADQFREINMRSIEAAHQARKEFGGEGVLVAGSLSHMMPMVAGDAKIDAARAASEQEMTDVFSELANLHKECGCDLILLEMMYQPERMRPAISAAKNTGLPFWVGLSARRGDDGQVLSFSVEADIPFKEIAKLAASYAPHAMGTMHTPANIIADANAIIADVYDGPLSAYPDSGYFAMPSWQFENIIPPEEFARYANDWFNNGTQIIGGCCGLSPEHIQMVAGN
ncbi:MAG: homocysteine S-methyltransferase family protein [Hyphomicrobiales bacterium]